MTENAQCWFKKFLLNCHTKIFLTFPDRHLGKDIHNNHHQQEVIIYSSFFYFTRLLISPVRQFPCRLIVSETSLAA